MLKTLFKLAIAALVVNAVWRVGTEYVAHMQFRESVRAATLAAGTRTQDDTLKQTILDQARAMDIPLVEERLTIRREERRVVIRGTYTKAIDVTPWWSYSRVFDWEVDVFVAPSLR